MNRQEIDAKAAEVAMRRFKGLTPVAPPKEAPKKAPTKTEGGK